jgi:hypothetical protein
MDKEDLEKVIAELAAERSQSMAEHREFQAHVVRLNGTPERPKSDDRGTEGE